MTKIVIIIISVIIAVILLVFPLIISLIEQKKNKKLCLHNFLILYLDQ